MRRTNEQFLQEAHAKHGDKFTYLSPYTKAREKVSMRCNTCDYEFSQVADSHLRGAGCGKCYGNIQKTHDEFLLDAYNVHGEEFEYLSEYVNSKDYVQMRHVKCGYVFGQSPHHHLSGSGCPKCAGRHITHEDFVERSRVIHGDEYEYLEQYTKSTASMLMYHKTCGNTYRQVVSDHLSGYGCGYCGGTRLKTHDEFVSIAIEVHGDTFDYLEEYITGRTKMLMRHVSCGYEFSRQPSSHLAGYDCPKCAGSVGRTHDEFLELAFEVHGDEYEYIGQYNGENKILMCHKKCGFEFEQSPYHHLNGSGCPKCNGVYSLSARKVESYLLAHNIEFKLEERFDDCRDIKPLPFDFYLPEYHILIEYDGRQHYDPIPFFGGQEKLESIQHHDSIKNEYCLTNDIPLIRIKYTITDIPTYLDDYLLPLL